MKHRRPFSALDEGAALSERTEWPMNVHLEAKIERRLDPLRLAAAIDAALERHPMARARQVPQRGMGNRLEWEVPHEADGPVLIRGGDVAGLLDQPLPILLSPRVRVLLDQDEDGPDQARLVLSAHHAALDGAAAVQLLRTIAQEYAGAETPAPSVPSAAAAPATTTSSLGGGLRSVFLSRPVDRVWAPGASGTPGTKTGYGVSRASLDDDTQRALDDDRPSGATVNDVLLSALHLALDSWNREHGASAGLFGVVMPIRSASAAGQVVNATTQATTYTRPDQRSTTGRLLEAVRAQTLAAKKPAGGSEPSTALSGLAALPVSARRKLPSIASAVTRDRSVASTRLSNLGRQELLPPGPGAEAFPVSSLWFSPPCRPPQPFVVGAVSLQGATTLTARWCRPDFDQAAADRLLAELVRCVQVVLGMPSEPALAPPGAGRDPGAAEVGQDGPLPSGVRRTLHYGKLFREEQQQPETFYRFLARDTVAQIQRYRSVAGARALDIGGGPGYLADALEAEGARCDVVDYSGEELYLFGRDPSKSLIGDGCRLPVKDGCLDLVVSSNVLEHVPDPSAFLREAVRVLKPDGLAYIAFTNWFSPWGGHETSPWHYLGGERAVARYERTWHLPPKNRFAESLFPVHVGETLTWVRQQPDVALLDAFPRYLPRWCRPLLAVPGVREVVTWNLVMILAPVASTARPLSGPPPGTSIHRSVPAVV